MNKQEIEKQTHYFRLIGLNKSKTFTCSNIGKEDIFWATCNWTDERFLALFKIAKETDDFWKSGWMVAIEHDGFFEDMTPRNPKVLYVKEVDKSEVL